MPVESQKLEPRARDDKNSRMNVTCIRMYPVRTTRMSSESAFCIDSWHRHIKHDGRRTYLGELPEAEHECAERICNPLAALHLANALLPFACVDVILDTIDDDRVLAPECGKPILARTRFEGKRKGGGGARLRYACEAGGLRRVEARVVAD